jgi:hypothetical protein
MGYDPRKARWEAYNSFDAKEALKDVRIPQRGDTRVWHFDGSRRCWYTHFASAVPPQLVGKLRGAGLTAYNAANTASADEPAEEIIPYDPWDEVRVKWNSQEKRWEAYNCYPIYTELKDLKWRCVYAKKFWHTSKPERIPPELVQRLEGAALEAYSGAAERIAADAERAAAAQAALLVDVGRRFDPRYNPEGLPLHPHQEVGVVTTYGRPHMLIHDEAGTGKTPMVYVAINATPSIEEVLVITPANLRLPAADEWTRWIVPDARTWHVHVAMTGGAWEPESNVIIVSWALMRTARVWERLMAIEWDLIIADEAHYAKNETTANALRFFGKFSRKTGSYGDLVEPGLIHRTKRAWQMTGTPMPNGRPAELWTALRGAGIFRPDQWKHYHDRYCEGHRVSHGSGSHYDISGSSNEGELRQILIDSGIWLRRRLVDVADMPPLQRTVIPLHVKGIAGALRREENAIKALSSEIKELESLIGESSDLEEEEGEQALGQKIKALRESLFGQIVKARHRTTLLKIPAIVSYLKGLLSSGNGNGGDVEGPRAMAPGEEESEPLKIVVVGWFRDVLEKIHEAFPEESVLFYGGSTPSQKTDALMRFEGGLAGHGDDHDPKCRLFITNPTSGGVGLTLTRSHTAVFAELDWRPGVINQAERRIFRISQKADHVAVHHLVLRGSIDERLVDSLVGKQGTISEVLGDDPEIIPKFTLQNTSDILAALVG